MSTDLKQHNQGVHFFGGSPKIAAEFEDQFVNNTGLHAVWMPGAPVSVGEVMLFQDGYHRKFDHLAARGISFETEDAAQLDVAFQSNSTRLVQTQGGVAVDAFNPNLGGSASLEVKFSRETGFYMRAQDASGVAMKNVATVARQIKEIKGTKWKHLPYRVVSKVYTAKDFMFLASEERASSVKFAGDVRLVLKVLNGKVDGSVSVSGTDRMLSAILGDESGPIAIELFRVTVDGRVVYV